MKRIPAFLASLALLLLSCGEAGAQGFLQWSAKKTGFSGTLSAGQFQGPVTATCAAPTYSFIGDLDTGLTSNGANTVDICTGSFIAASFFVTGMSASTITATAALLSPKLSNSGGVIGLEGTTASFPGIKRSGTTLQARLADDSADAPISGSTITATTAFSAPNGTAAAPSLFGTNFTTTGAYWAAGLLGFSVAGSEKLRVTTDGNGALWTVPAGNLTVGTTAGGTQLFLNALLNTQVLVNGAPITTTSSTGLTMAAGKIVDAPTLTPTGGTTAMTGTLTVTAIASSAAAQSGYLCYNTTAPGTITYDGGATCLVSREEWKDNYGPILHATDELMKLKPFWGRYKVETPMADKRIQPFLGARHTAKVDERLTSFDKAGEPLGVRYENMVAVLVAAIQEQQREINALKQAIAKK